MLQIKTSSILEILSVISLFCLAFITTMLSLNQTAYANGWDGYYYLIQVKAYLTEGSMHSRDISLIYPLLILIQKITNDYILTYKLTAALIKSVFVLGTFFLSKTLLKHSNKKPQLITSIVLSMIVLISSSSFFFTAQFPKNLLGFTFLLFFLLSLINKDQVFSQPNFSFFSLWKLKLPFLLFIATFISHRFSGTIALILAALYFFRILKATKNYRLLLFALLFMTGVLTFSLVFPGTLHFFDLERFSDLFSLAPTLTPFAFIQLLGTHKFSLIWITEIISFSLIAIYSFYLFAQNLIQKKENSILKFLSPILLICFLGLFPFYQFNLMGMAYRFFTAFLLFSPLLFLLILKKIPLKLLYILLFFLSILTFITPYHYDPKKFDPPYAFYEKISFEISNALLDTKYDLLIAHKALAEILTFSTGKDALPWQPEDNYETHLVWRVSAGLKKDHFKAFLKQEEISQIRKLKKDYLLIREDLWQKFVLLARGSKNKAILEALESWRNPQEKRPNFILKGRIHGKT